MKNVILPLKSVYRSIITRKMTQSHPPLPSSLSVRQSLLARWFPGVRPFACTPLRVAGMFPVIIVLIIQGLAYVTAVPGTLVPLFTTLPLTSSALLIVFHVVFFMTLFNYLLLVLMDPGFVPSDWKAPCPDTFHQQRHPMRQQQQHQQQQQFRIPFIPPTPSKSDDRAHIQPTVQIQPMEEPPVQEPFRYAHLMKERTYQGYLRYCQVCKAYKPDRAHHCSVCKRCVLRMDHHCVFVNNCVSFYNHKFFISFVTYAFLGCVIVSVISFPTFADIISLPSRSSEMYANPNTFSGHFKASAKLLLDSAVHLVSSIRRHFHQHIQNEELLTIHEDVLAQLSAARHLSTLLKTAVMIGYIVSSAFSFALGVFVSLHFYLVSKGRTTIEMYEMTDPVRAPFVAKYDLGLRRNVQKVCGTVPLCWLFPTRAYIEGDGLHYERRDDPVVGDGSTQMAMP